MQQFIKGTTFTMTGKDPRIIEEAYVAQYSPTKGLTCLSTEGNYLICLDTKDLQKEEMIKRLSYAINAGVVSHTLTDSLNKTLLEDSLALLFGNPPNGAMCQFT